MGHAGRSAAKAEYNKPRLKEQIDAAMAAFIKSGRAVERVPTVLAPEPIATAEAAADGEAEDDVETEEPTTVEAAPPEIHED